MMPARAWPLVIVFLSGTMFPATSAAGSGWTEAARILEVQANEHGRFLVRLDVERNASGCRETQWFFREYFGVGTTQMLDALLSAMRAKAAVRVYVTGNCHLQGYAEISAVAVAG